MTLTSWRRKTPEVLAAILLMALIGTGIELLLMEHFDGWRQWVPLVLLALGILSLGIFLIKPVAATLRALRIMMLLFCVAGAVGSYFHYTGNVEFELERTPEILTLELFKASMQGATPVLAPGVMIHFGLLGFLVAYLYSARPVSR